MDHAVADTVICYYPLVAYMWHVLKFEYMFAAANSI